MSLSPSARQSFFVFSGTLASRILGFVRVILIGTTLGYTRLSDSYSLANETPNMMYELILGSLIASTMVPFFVQQYKRKDRDADHALMSFVFISAIGLTGLTLLLTPVLAQMMTALNSSSTAQAQENLVIFFLLFLLPQIFFYAMTAAMQAFLAARSRFVAAAFAPIINNVVVIATLLYIRTRKGELDVPLDQVKSSSLMTTLAVGTTLGVMLVSVVVGIVYIRAGGRLSYVSINNKHVKALISRSKWMVAYSLVNQIALFAIIAFANTYNGGVVMYLVAWSFFQLPHGLFANSIMTTMIPRITHTLEQSDVDVNKIRMTPETGTITRQTATGLTIAMSVISALGIAIAVPVMNLLIGHGSISASQAEHTGRVLIGFLVFLPAFSLYLFNVRLSNSLNKTKTIFFTNVLQNTCNVLFALLFRDSFTVVGLSVAFSLSYLVVIPLSIHVMSKELKVSLLFKKPTAVMVLTCSIAALGGFLVSERINNIYAAIPAGLTVCILVQCAGSLLARDELMALARLAYRRKNFS